MIEITGASSEEQRTAACVLLNVYHREQSFHESRAAREEAEQMMELTGASPEQQEPAACALLTFDHCERSFNEWRTAREEPEHTIKVVSVPSEEQRPSAECMRFAEPRYARRILRRVPAGAGKKSVAELGCMSCRAELERGKILETLLRP